MRFVRLESRKKYDIVETRMVGSELTIFSNIIWRIYNISLRGFIRVSTLPPPQVAAS